METKTKKYNVKNVDMIIAAATVLEAAINNKALLQSKRSSWTDTYFAKLKTRIDKAAHELLGIDGVKQLREATRTVLSVQKDALTDLAEAKVQITEDFKKIPGRSNEILKQLGFADYYNTARKKNQEGLIQLLFRFKANLTPELQKEIQEAGTDAAVLVRIVNYTAILKGAEVTQETFKGERKVITAETTEEFNNIYDAVISICKITSKFLKTEPAMKAQFNFKKIVKSLSISTKDTKPDETKS